MPAMYLEFCFIMVNYSYLPQNRMQYLAVYHIPDHRALIFKSSKTGMILFLPKGSFGDGSLRGPEKNLVIQSMKTKEEMENIYTSAWPRSPMELSPQGPPALRCLLQKVKASQGKVAMETTAGSDHQHWAHHVKPSCLSSSSPCLHLPLLIPSEQNQVTLRAQLLETDLWIQCHLSHSLAMRTGSFALPCLGFLIDK